MAKKEEASDNKLESLLKKIYDIAGVPAGCTYFPGQHNKDPFSIVAAKLAVPPCFGGSAATEHDVKVAEKLLAATEQYEKSRKDNLMAIQAVLDELKTDDKYDKDWYNEVGKLFSSLSPSTVCGCDYRPQKNESKEQHAEEKKNRFPYYTKFGVYYGL